MIETDKEVVDKNGIYSYPKSKRDTSDWQPKCPYYVSENDKVLKCMGVVGDCTQSWFATKLEKKEHKADFCCTCYRGCPLFQMLNELVDVL